MQTLGSVLNTFFGLGELWNAPTPFEFTVTVQTTRSSGLLLSVGDKNRHVVVYIMIVHLALYLCCLPA